MKIREDSKWDERYAPVLYRPFDTREMYYVPWMVDWPRNETMPHMLAGENLSVGLTRTVEVGAGFSHVFASRAMIQHHTVSLKEVNYQIPLYLFPGVGNGDLPLFSRWAQGKGGRTPNLESAVVKQVAAVTGLRFVTDGRGDLRETIGPEDILAWIYALLHSPSYRDRYEAHLKLEFPRVPLAGDAELFRELAEAGHELIALHVLESHRLHEVITTYSGPKKPEVGRVGWSYGTVWLDAGTTSARESHRTTKPGTIGFHGVPEGGLGLPDRRLSSLPQVAPRIGRAARSRTDDLAHYQKIVVALNETICIMTEVDEIIDVHGGWPDAFQAGSEIDPASVGTAKGGSVPATHGRARTRGPLRDLRAAR